MRMCVFQVCVFTYLNQRHVEISVYSEKGLKKTVINVTLEVKKARR